MHDDYRDDVAWESDRIAFRIYGQGVWQASEFEPLRSSGIDVWPKRVRDLIVTRWYEKGHDAYHVDTGEGADFYSVGTTLESGGTAVWRNGQLHRALNFKSYRILADGPVRAVFELTYDPWDAAGTQVVEVKRISIDAGQNLYRQESVFTGAPESERVADMRETADHYIAVSRVRQGAPLVLYGGAGWTASGDFASVEDWWAHLDRFAERLANPLRVTVEAR